MEKWATCLPPAPPLPETAKPKNQIGLAKYPNLANFVKTLLFMLHPSIQRKAPALTAFLRRHQVARAYIFGSATTQNFRPDSDVDLLVAFEVGLSNSDYARHFWSLYLELPKLLGTRLT